MPGAGILEDRRIVSRLLLLPLPLGEVWSTLLERMRRGLLEDSGTENVL
jgi:hypothetical protein